MITLNTEKGLVNIDNWEDIVTRPGFIEDLNPLEHKLDIIIGKYDFQDKKVKCGLSNCHSSHNKGYIVITKDGSETNIAQRCGKSYFEENFSTLSNKFERDIFEKDIREKLWGFHLGIEKLNEKLKELKLSQKGATWIHKNTSILCSRNKGCPTRIVDVLSKMIKDGRSELNIERNATESEIETLELNQGKTLSRPFLIQEKIAEIAGIEALYDGNNLKEIICIEIEEKLSAFKKIKINELTYNELKYWGKWIGTVELNILKAENAITIGRKLLNADNLKPLLITLTKKEDKLIFTNYLAGLQADDGRSIAV